MSIVVQRHMSQTLSILIPYTKVKAVPQDSGLREQIRQLSEGITDTL